MHEASRQRAPAGDDDDDDDPRPSPPGRPDPDDCCRSGCDPCVFDLYDAALDRYHAALAAWQARHALLASPAKKTR